MLSIQTKYMPSLRPRMREMSLFRTNHLFGLATLGSLWKNVSRICMWPWCGKYCCSDV